jgi:uroporphyrinogen-III decarboxylase
MLNVLEEYADRIQKNRRFLTRMWNLDNDERPGFMVVNPGPKVKGGVTVEHVMFRREGSETVRDRLLDPDKYLESQLYVNGQMMLNRGDVVPFLMPSIGVVALPSALGCEIVWWEDDLPAARPAITDPAQVYSLPRPKITDGVMGMALGYIRRWLDRTGGKYPISMADCQSPLDVAALVLGHNNYLMALYTHPKEIHYLLQMITETEIEFIQAQRDLIHQYGAEFVGTNHYPWIPDGFGVNMSHDENVMISPDMHDEFGVPYLNQIADAFNGVFIHSCGKFSHNLRSFEKVHKLRGLEFGASEAPFGPVIDYFNGKIVLSVRVGLHRDLRFDSMMDFTRRVLSASRTNRGLFINLDITNGIVPDDWPVVDLEEIFGLLT